MVREAKETELSEIMELYLNLHKDPLPELSDHLISTWKQIIQDDKHHLIVYVTDHRIVSSCVCVIIPNLTRNVRPYALIENVVTEKDYRGRGYATQCLSYAETIARKCGCYKIMLLTGTKRQSTLNFYKNAGYNCNDKTAFVRWLD